MNISQVDVLDSIDGIIAQLKKDIHRQSRHGKFPWKVFHTNQNRHEDTILALRSRIRDYEVLRQFITNRVPKFTPFVQMMWVDANRLRRGMPLLEQHYSTLAEETILPYLAFTFPQG